ncbi:MAG TPA: thioesterase family protein [Acidimicrobiales bacterium]|nr:thioesterase family protein [Acidimicrobiales bacterium]
MTVEETPALFAGEGDVLLPLPWARGPWTPEALHGGPVAAAIVRAAEQCRPEADAHLSRLTVELLRPVPMAPLEVTAEMVRPGRKVQVIDVRVRAGDLEVAWGRALRIRSHAPGDPAGAGLSAAAAEGPVPGTSPAAPPGPGDGHGSPALVSGYLAFHNEGAELRFVRGEFDRLGPSAVWIRLAVPVVAGEEPSPAQRAVVAADFGNGVSAELDYEHYVYINPDLTVYLERPPVGEWVCLEATTRLGTPGVGLAQSVLWDELGPVGRSLQSLVTERR